MTIVDWLLSIVCLSILNNRLAKPSQQPIKAGWGQNKTFSKPSVLDMGRQFMREEASRRRRWVGWRCGWCGGVKGSRHGWIGSSRGKMSCGGMCWNWSSSRHQSCCLMSYRSCGRWIMVRSRPRLKKHNALVWCRLWALQLAHFSRYDDFVARGVLMMVGPAHGLNFEQCLLPSGRLLHRQCRRPLPTGASIASKVWELLMMMCCSVMVWHGSDFGSTFLLVLESCDRVSDF
jgi:hypothetical protein